MRCPCKRKRQPGGCALRKELEWLGYGWGLGAGGATILLEVVSIVVPAGLAGRIGGNSPHVDLYRPEEDVERFVTQDEPGVSLGAILGGSAFAQAVADLLFRATIVEGVEFAGYARHISSLVVKCPFLLRFGSSIAQKKGFVKPLTD